MSQLPDRPPLHPDPARNSALYRHIAAQAVAMLPQPQDDTPAGRERLEHHALEQVAALTPGNAAEASLAAQYVACTASAAEFLRLASLHQANAPLSLQLARQAATMLREARSTRTMLSRLQACRREHDADPIPPKPPRPQPDSSSAPE